MVNNNQNAFRQIQDLIFAIVGLIIGASIIAIVAKIAIITGIIGIAISICITALTIAIRKSGGINIISK